MNNISLIQDSNQVPYFRITYLLSHEIPTQTREKKINENREAFDICGSTFTNPRNNIYVRQMFYQQS